MVLMIWENSREVMSDCKDGGRKGTMWPSNMEQMRARNCLKIFGGQVSDFKNAVHTKRREQDYTLANIGTMDETMDETKITWGPNRDDVRRLLILDQARVHTMNDTKTALANVQTDIIYVPAGCTSIAQPADVSWNAPFKQIY